MSMLERRQQKAGEEGRTFCDQAVDRAAVLPIMDQGYYNLIF